MSGETYTLKCRVCGREFTVTGARRKGTKYCPECRALIHAARKRESESRSRKRDTATMYGINHGERDINHLIAEAKTKPDCVSDARWRIELRRRANKDYFNYCPAVVR